MLIGINIIDNKGFVLDFDERVGYIKSYGNILFSI
jgi:hypothetical protein